MIYGLWLSATGVVTNSHQTDVIANNLANAETTGFRRQMVSFVERAPERQVQPGLGKFADPRLDRIGGGQLLGPSSYDRSEGVIEETGSKLDVALSGDGYLAVQDAKGNTRLTRSGNLLLKPDGSLVLGSANGEAVLDDQQRPIRLDLAGIDGQSLDIGGDGAISVDGGLQLGKMGVFSVPDPRMLRPTGGSLLKAPDSVALQPGTASVQQGYLERSNVDPTTELTRLMEAQRQLEANANLIRYQDQTLAAAVNTVGKIG